MSRIPKLDPKMTPGKKGSNFQLYRSYTPYSISRLFTAILDSKNKKLIKTSIFLGQFFLFVGLWPHDLANFDFKFWFYVTFCSRSTFPEACTNKRTSKQMLNKISLQKKQKKIVEILKNLRLTRRRTWTRGISSTRAVAPDRERLRTGRCNAPADLSVKPEQVTARSANSQRSGCPGQLGSVCPPPRA